MSVQVDELNSNLANLKAAIARANARVLAKLDEMHAQIIAGATTDDLTSALSVIKQDICDIDGILPPSPPSDPVTA